MIKTFIHTNFILDLSNIQSRYVESVLFYDICLNVLISRSAGFAIKLFNI